MILLISKEETLPLRSEVLRKGLAPSECYMPEDQNPDTFHLGYFTDEKSDKPVCILSCQKESHGKLPGIGYRLRGMATDPAHTRKGYAKALIEELQTQLKNEREADYLWFNAREIAFPFYEALGFEFMSDMFEIAGIGPHKEMFKML